MIVAQEKGTEDIVRMLKGYQRIVVVGCGTCTTICLAGGEKEAGELAARLQKRLSLDGSSPEVSHVTVERQCELDFVQSFLGEGREADAIVSLGCGAGVQTLAHVLEDTAVFPGLDTAFIGSYLGEGEWSEMCTACGDCILDLTAGICPVARCTKSLMNGPCGGSVRGKCEVNPDKDCAWHLIYHRLTKLNQLHLLGEIIPPKRWTVDPSDAGPRKRVKRGVGSSWL